MSQAWGGGQPSQPSRIRKRKVPGGNFVNDEEELQKLEYVGVIKKGSELRTRVTSPTLLLAASKEERDRCLEVLMEKEEIILPMSYDFQGRPEVTLRKQMDGTRMRIDSAGSPLWEVPIEHKGLSPKNVHDIAVTILSNPYEPYVNHYDKLAPVIVLLYCMITESYVNEGDADALVRIARGTLVFGLVEVGHGLQLPMTKRFMPFRREAQEFRLVDLEASSTSSRSRAPGYEAELLTGARLDNGIRLEQAALIDIGRRCVSVAIISLFPAVATQHYTSYLRYPVSESLYCTDRGEEGVLAYNSYDDLLLALDRKGFIIFAEGALDMRKYSRGGAVHVHQVDRLISQSALHYKDLNLYSVTDCCRAHAVPTTQMSHARNSGSGRSGEECSVTNLLRFVECLKFSHPRGIVIWRTVTSGGGEALTNLNGKTAALMGASCGYNYSRAQQWVSPQIHMLTALCICVGCHKSDIPTKRELEELRLDSDVVTYNSKNTSIEKDI